MLHRRLVDCLSEHLSSDGLFDQYQLWELPPEIEQAYIWKFGELHRMTSVRMKCDKYMTVADAITDDAKLSSPGFTTLGQMKSTTGASLTKPGPRANTIADRSCLSIPPA